MNLNTKHPFTSNTEPSPSVLVGIVAPISPTSSLLYLLRGDGEPHIPSPSNGSCCHSQPARAGCATPHLPAGRAITRRGRGGEPATGACTSSMGPRRRSGCRRTSSMWSAQRGSSPWVTPPPFFPTTGAVAPHPLFPPAGDPCAAATHLRHAAPLRCRDLPPRGDPLHHRTPPLPPPFSQIPISPELRHRETHPLVGSTSV